MITKLYIKAFKCFEEENLTFRNLTILTGTNGSGKSSVIQAILKLALHSNSDYSSPLSNYLSYIAEFNDAVNFNLDEHEYRLGIDGFGSELKYLFKEDGSINTISNPKAIHSKLSYSKANLIFLSADRIGPQDTYSKNINPLDQFGILGEYTISFLEKARRNKEEVINELIHENEPRKMLDSQVNYWLKYILDTEIETEEIPQTNQVKARFKNSNAYVRPKNIGSGISYLTSILIVCLSAKIGQIIIIENPEIHLHPKAQSKIGELLAFVASKGIQIIIETHNDHLINRLRYEVFKKKIEANKIIIHYKESLLPFEQIEINDNGKFKDKNGENNFPKGFYDATLKEIFEINQGL